MYDDPMREQMRQAHRLARLQAITGQAIGGAMPGAQPVPVAPAHQPFDFARTISGGIGGQAGWMAGAHLASKLASAAPHPALKAAGMAANFGIPVLASLLGATALPTAIDAVSPSIHDSANSVMQKAGPAGALAGAGLGAYLMWRNRKGLPAITPEKAGVRAFLPHNPSPSSVSNPMVGSMGQVVRGNAPVPPVSYVPRTIVPSAPVPAPAVPAPTLQQAAGHVMTDIVKDPLMASQPIQAASIMMKHLRPHVESLPLMTDGAGYHPHEAQAMAEALHPAPGIAPIPAIPEGNVFRHGFGLKKNSRKRPKA